MALRAFGNRFPLPRFLSSGKWLFYDTPIKMAALNSPLATGPLTLFRTTFYGPDGVIVMALYQLQRIVELQSPSIECLANNGRISPSYDSNRKQGISHLGSASATQSNDESPAQWSAGSYYSWHGLSIWVCEQLLAEYSTAHGSWPCECLDNWKHHNEYPLMGVTYKSI